MGASASLGKFSTKFQVFLVIFWLLRCAQVSQAQCEGPCEGTGAYTLGQEPLPKDCKDIQDRGLTKSGVYTIFPQDVYLCVSLRVYCDMETDGGGWTVFQRRYDNRQNFFLRWLDYRLGFGSLGAEFWLGNEHLYHITPQDDYLLRVDLEDFDGGKSWATYAEFRIGSETDNYRLYIGNYTGGDAGDSLSAHRGSSFSTSDSDLSGGQCSSFRGGAWWYPRLCGDSNLNGRYLAGVHTEFGEGVMWHTWRGLTYSLRRTELKFRPMVASDRQPPTTPQETGGKAGEVDGEAEGDTGEVVEGEDTSSSVSSSSVEEEPEEITAAEPTEMAPELPFKGRVKGNLQPRKNKKKKSKGDKGRL
ncbi:microfibril-associated glycoprotein 4-like [Acanthaster planci]|uniref:Microfibril-associated glycoprotein 4-like n=1 Tax=Acanthaster planci TaxID=133434 RepID=A0A8B7XIW1_ACAPL|nr:microfibril-associated glycoprotein 4-like [Acanthaster planci]